MESHPPIPSQTAFASLVSGRTSEEAWLHFLLDGGRAGVRQHSHTSEVSLAHETARPVGTLGAYHTRIAVLPEERRAAEELVRRRYAWRGYKLSEPDDFRATTSPLGKGPLILLAERRGALSGTLTVRRDSPRGMLAEHAYGVEVEKLRANGRRLGELVKLAVEKGADWKATLDALVQAAYLVTRVLSALTDVLIEVNPRHVHFYERVFGFVVAAAERVCSRVGAPSVLMRLDLALFGERLHLSGP